MDSRRLQDRLYFGLGRSARHVGRTADAFRPDGPFDPLQHTACKLGQPLPYRGRRNLMPGSYSTDLRERVLVAIEAGEPADVVAEAFMIGRSSVYRWVATARDEGRRVPKPMGGGSKPIIRDETEAALCRLLAANNHL